MTAQRDTDEAGAGVGTPDPKPLRPPRTPATFPVDVFPKWASDFVTGEARATQTPADMAGCCALGVLSSCAGGRVVVEARPGWREPLNTFIVPVLPPGSRKSAVVSACTTPLYQAEQELIQQARGTITEARMLRDIAQQAADKAMRAAGAKPGDAKLTADAVGAAQQVENVVIPVTPRLIADDITAEAVGTLLAEHGGRLSVISAEGGLFDTIAGRYSSQRIPSLDVWLKGHSGDPLRVDRKGRPAEFVQSPALTLLLTVQPTVLASITGNGEFRGRGLLARVLFSLPPDNVGHRQIGAAPVSPEVTDAYATNVRKLAAELADWSDPAVLTLSPDAAQQLLAFEKVVEPRLRRDGEWGGIREWASKLVGATVRLAGLLHLASEEDWLGELISETTLKSAIRLAGYFAEHAQAAFGAHGGSDTDASYVLEHIRRAAVPAFSLRDLHRELPAGRFPKVDLVTAAVDVLVDHGHLISIPLPEKKGPGRRPSPRFAAHPTVVKPKVTQRPPGQNRQNRQNSPDGPPEQHKQRSPGGPTQPGANRRRNRQKPATGDASDSVPIADDSVGASSGQENRSSGASETDSVSSDSSVRTNGEAA